MPPKDKEASTGVAKKLQEEFMPHPKHFAFASKGHVRKKKTLMPRTPISFACAPSMGDN